MSTPRVKICGLTRRSDAESAASAGASYGGVILARGGKRSITPEAAADLFADLPLLLRVGVFVDASIEEMRRAAETVRLDVLQLQGSESPETVGALRASGSWAIWKTVHVRDPEALTRAADRYAGVVDGLHLDGWSPEAPGGTGTAFDWESLVAHRERVPESISLVVAGGLNPENVARAVALLRPDVVDVSSGVELSPGVKDPAAVAAFVAAVRGTRTEPID